jgi:hypothetical protein
MELFPTFEECPRRVYMSATIADDSSIIRTFDAGLDAALKPIAPPTLAGVGERMILAPVLMALGKHDPVDVIKKIAPQVAKQAGVVILTPSEPAAQRWKDIAELAIGDGVAKVVNKLLSARSRGPYVLANRYDGIDLIGDACRLLVMDGLPRGANTYDLYRADPARAIWALVGRLDLSAFYRAIESSTEEGGRPAFDPQLLISLWYAYSQGCPPVRRQSP